jgi:hypothetical protein
METKSIRNHNIITLVIFVVVLFISKIYFPQYNFDYEYNQNKSYSENKIAEMDELQKIWSYSNKKDQGKIERTLYILYNDCLSKNIQIPARNSNFVLTHKI